MARYFIQHRPRAAWNENGEYIQDHIPTVSDHEAVDTGLIDVNGGSIMRAPYPMGFGKDEEW